MPIAFETGGGQGGGGAQLGGRRRGHAQAAASSWSSGRGSDSRAAVMECGEGDEDDGEVESSFKGPLDTMDTLQDALLSNRRGVSKFYNGKSSPVADVVSSPQPAKHVARNPSPKKRKGLLSFSFSWGKGKSRSKESSSRVNVTNNPKSSRKTLSPAATSCASGNSRMSDNERGFFQDRPRRSLQIGRGAALRSQLISVQMKALSVAGLEDVSESTDSISPREKRRKSLE
ncbi:hypothetical protein QOZ80_6BG0464620 [Eleusine coracana subsp. coracana]|nr:hypothetical protein QOZ80_6BG0464620 [Eleusine coracana subsp. coracana]